MIYHKQGFSLVELMVVVVIVGILAAIAVPKMFGMSHKAKFCSNLTDEYRPYCIEDLTANRKNKLMMDRIWSGNGKFGYMQWLRENPARKTVVVRFIKNERAVKNGTSPKQKKKETVIKPQSPILTAQPMVGRDGTITQSIEAEMELMDEEIEAMMDSI